MASVVSRYWTSRRAGIDVPRRDRWSGSYQAYVPDSLSGRVFGLSAITAADVSDAELAIARLDARAQALTDTEALARLLLRAEAIASSHIEGLRMPARNLLRAVADREDGEPVSNAIAHEIVGNVDAIAYALSNPSAPVTVDRLNEVQRRLLGNQNERRAGVRDVQNWIGRSDVSPNGADFIPPPPEMVPALLDDLCIFCNDDAVSPIVQAAIAHAQFETIHPYIDGNGRTGRALIYMTLRRRGLAVRCIPPISLILATQAASYVKALSGTRFIGDSAAPEAEDGMDAWIALFASACVRATADAERFEARVETLIAQWRTALGRVRSDAGVLLLLNRLPSMPFLTITMVARAIGRDFRSARDAVDALVRVNVLHEVTGGRRNRTFETTELIDAFADLERALASPTGNTQTAAPTREVPKRKRQRRPGEKS